MNENNNTIKVYGATWCGDCRRTKGYLDSHTIPYDFINIDEDEAAIHEVIRLNNGLRSIPTVVLPNGVVLVEPSNEELEKALTAVQEVTISHKMEEKV